MASEQQQALDRRRALGMIGKASAAVAIVAVPGAAIARAPGSGATGVDAATAAREFEAGAHTIPLEEILPDGASPELVAEARQQLHGRIKHVVQMLLQHQQERAPLVTAKFSMHRVRKDVHEALAGVAAGTLPVPAARERMRAAFELYFAEMRALGAR